MWVFFISGKIEFYGPKTGFNGPQSYVKTNRKTLPKETILMLISR